VMPVRSQTLVLQCLTVADLNASSLTPHRDSLMELTGDDGKKQIGGCANVTTGLGLVLEIGLEIGSGDS